jgi:hypothetical protein
MLHLGHSFLWCRKLRLRKVDHKYLEILNYGPGEECKDGLIVCENNYYIGRRKGGIPYKQ